MADWDERDHPRDPHSGEFIEDWASRVVGAMGGRHRFQSGRDLVGATDWEPIQQAAMAPSQFGGMAINWRKVQRVIYEMQGYDAKPHVVTRQEMGRLVGREGYHELFRGVGSSTQGVSGQTKLRSLTAEQTAELFRTGDEHYVGDGYFVVATYTVGDAGTASEYGDAVLRIGLHPDARVYVMKHRAGTDDLPQAPTDAGQFALADFGTHVAAAGYDAILVPAKGRIRGSGGDYYVILNRGAVAVQEADT